MPTQFAPGTVVKRADIKGRKLYVVLRQDNYGWTYCSLKGDGNWRAVYTFLPATLKEAES